MHQLTPSIGRHPITVTIAPDELIPHTINSPVPVVGYLVLAPAGTPLDELIPALGQQRHPDDDATAPRPGPEPVGELGSGEGLHIDEAQRVATVDGARLDLTYLEFELLAYLVRNPNQVHAREHLVVRIWDYNPVGSQRTVDVHVARLRRKLGRKYRERIVTVHRVGYKYCPRA